MTLKAVNLGVLRSVQGVPGPRAPVGAYVEEHPAGRCLGSQKTHLAVERHVAEVLAVSGVVIEPAEPVEQTRRGQPNDQTEQRLFDEVGIHSVGRKS